MASIFCQGLKFVSQRIKSGTNTPSCQETTSRRTHDWYDAYAQLLDVTGRINKAYALKFEHDVLVLAGTYLVIPSDNCNPPKHRATFNKIGLLKHALRHRNKYDQLLILDTDAMMYNLSFDVTTLVSEQRNENSMLTDEESTMLVAHRVKKNGTLHTWDVNIGVTVSTDAAAV